MQIFLIAQGNKATYFVKGELLHKPYLQVPGFIVSLQKS